MITNKNVFEESISMEIFLLHSLASLSFDSGALQSSIHRKERARFCVSNNNGKLTKILQWGSALTYSNELHLNFRFLFNTFLVASFAFFRHN